MTKFRFYFLFIVLMTAFSGLIGRFWYLQIYTRKSLPLRQEQVIERGIIYDRQGRALVLSVLADSVWANPGELADKEKIALTLAKILGQEKKELLARLNRKGQFVWLARRIEPVQAGQIKVLGVKGINLKKEHQRLYPYKKLASQILGYVNIDDQGKSGIEKVFEERLKVEDDFSNCSLTLTLDADMQAIAEKYLEETVTGTRAQRGMVLVEEVASGEILASASFPSFDPAGLNRQDEKLLSNPVVSDVFEPGSTFKIITACAALEEKLKQTQEKIYCENGIYYAVKKYPIRDHEKRGWLTFSEVLEYSSNIGMAKIGESIGKERFYYYMTQFGFGMRTGLTLPNESSGLLTPVKQWKGLALSRMSFGQGLGVTAIQLTNAVCCVANQGVLMQPYIVKKIVDEQGRIIEYQPRLLRKRVISTETAKRINEILVNVVEKGTGQKAKIDGYLVAGKTGTAQKFDRLANSYTTAKYVSSFVGYLPASAPRLAIFVAIDEPQTDYWGGNICAPLFKKVAQEIIFLLNIPPDKTDLIYSGSLNYGTKKTS